MKWLRDDGKTLAIWRGCFGSYYIESDYLNSEGKWWVFDPAEGICQMRCDGNRLASGPPPSETLRTLIECGAPWYAVLDKFVEEYPQWEEVLTWAPTTATEGC